MTHSSRTTRAVCIMTIVAAGLLPVGAVAQGTRATEGEVLAIVDSLFASMARRDTAAARRVMMPGAAFYSVRNDGAPAMPRVQSDTAFLRSLTAGTDKFLERYWSPVVSVSGAIAQVWTPYDFHINNAFSHCGIDTFSMMRTPDGWKLAAITYTVQRQGCAPSPLGAPK